MKKFLQNLKADKKFRNTVISVTSVVVALAIILSSVLFITNRNKNKVEIGNKSESASDSRAVVAEPESESATIAQSNEESTSQIDEQNSQTESSEPASQSGNVKTDSGTQNRKPVNNTTTTTKQHSGNTVTTTKTNSGNGGSAVNTCNHNWKLMGYGAGCYNYHCSKCDEWKSEEREMNPNDFMGTQSEYLDLLKIINAERSKNGLIPFAYKSEWQAGADQRAKELIVKFTHTRPDGRKATTAYTDLGFDVFSAGENIAKGYSNPQSVFNAWMNSEGHRNALMANGNNEQIEVCIARCNNCWVISFLVY